MAISENSLKNLIPSQKGEPSRNPNGRPKGAKNRSTIARMVLDRTAKIPATILSDLKVIFPDLSENITVEEFGTLVQAHKMIYKKDTKAYTALMNSSYGAPVQVIEVAEGETGELTDKEARLLEAFEQLGEEDEAEESDESTDESETDDSQTV